MTTRRAWLASAAAAAAVPVAPTAGAQEPARRPAARVGFLGLYSPQSYAVLLDAFVQGLAGFGWREGHEIRIEYRWAEGREDRLPGLAAELVALRPDVIATHTIAGIRAVQRATSTIPIVMGVAADPVAFGLVQSLARPGGNTTGVSSQVVELAPKRFELLMEAAPGLKSIAMLSDAGHPATPLGGEAVVAAARRSGAAVRTVTLDADVSTVDAALAALARDGTEGLIVEPYPRVSQHQARIVAHAMSRRMPTIGGLRSFVESGGLLGYSTDFAEGWRLAARYVHRILGGAKAQDLPVEQPTKFELSVNARTARALGFSVPRSILVRADLVIR